MLRNLAWPPTPIFVFSWRTAAVWTALLALVILRLRLLLAIKHQQLLLLLLPPTPPLLVLPLVHFRPTAAVPRIAAAHHIACLPGHIGAVAPADPTAWASLPPKIRVVSSPGSGSHLCCWGSSGIRQSDTPGIPSMMLQRQLVPLWEARPVSAASSGPTTSTILVRIA